MHSPRTTRLLGLGLAVVLVASACGGDAENNSKSTTTESTVPSTSSGTVAAQDPLDLSEGETVVFEVEVVLAGDPPTIIFAPNCYTLSADGTFDDPGFPNTESPVLGTWETGWDGTTASYVAEAHDEESGLTLVQTGAVTVDEAGGLSLAAESTVVLNGETVAMVTSTGQAVESCTPVPG